MNKSPFKKGFLWLSAGVLLFLVSFALYLYDSSRSDDDIRREIQQGLQEDFDACLRYHNLDSLVRTQVPRPACLACELTYDELGRLKTWDENEYLPTQEQIGRLQALNDSIILSFENRVYYQVRTRNGPNTHVTLIPLQISYNINNEFLLPFVFLGRWQKDVSEAGDVFPSLFEIEDLRNLQVLVDAGAIENADIQIADHAGRKVFAIKEMPIEAYRFEVRAAVIIFFILGFLAVCIYLRIYAINHWEYRYYINLGLLVGVVLFRLALWASELPATYIDIDLFSPKILAFQEFLAPSLGDLTINIMALAVIVLILYVHFFRLLNLAYRRIITHRIWSWPMAIATLVISSWLLKVYIDFFNDITLNSQVDIAFSNIFTASIYSFIILLDVGILLLSFTLVIISLLKFNVLFGQRERNSFLFILVHLLCLVGVNLFLHSDGNWPLAAVIISCIGLMFILVYRRPFRPILHYDLINYFFMIAAFSTLVTYNVAVGIERSNQAKAERIAGSVLGSQLSNTVYTYEMVMSNLEADSVEIGERYQNLKVSSAYNQFSEWLNETYISPNFTQFDVSLYMYDAQNDRLDGITGNIPTFGPEAMVPIHERSDAMAVNEEKSLFQLPNFENNYLDLYVGFFNRQLGDDTLQFVLELRPSRLETEGLYPSLSLDEVFYEDIKLVNSLDHAVYREGVLYSSGGESAFPIYLDDYEQYTSSETREGVSKEGRKYKEVIQPIGNQRVVVVRYWAQSFFQVITTFSFIFYFFSLASLLLVVLPVYGLRAIRTQSIGHHLPLRAKVRSGLLTISILPMLIIIGFLTPFISTRYEEEAKKELGEEAKRISDALEHDYIIMRNDALSRLTLFKEFEKKVENMSAVIRNDINVYDERGMRVASTQPMIYKHGLRSDLMNARAFDMMEDGELSELVIDEKVGNLSYFSGYKPIIGYDRKPVGYVNIPFLTQQDELEEQVLDFLAYLANIYLLVFLMINLMAVLVSNTITQPLSLIQQRLSATNLGNTNKPIKYDAKDEIGEIVTAYNRMVDKLAKSERKLTQTQRELAWRQMARQVAHEIKNPLTPMRLSIQHLERAWKGQSSNLDKMFPRVMKTLMVQIDSLVRIANSFHEFAKMPDPVKDRVLVNDVLLEVVDLYAQSEEATWLIDVPQEQFYALSDRDQLSRCFGNIIKNGLQAMDENGTMHIAMRIEQRHAYIYIKDNGKGMSEEVQKKVFEPNFSTKTSGMGLGLAIVKRIIESSGGNIDFQSQPGDGTTFTIVLPSADLM